MTIYYIITSSVDDGAIIDVNFEKFYYEPPQGYSCIMKEQDML